MPTPNQTNQRITYFSFWYYNGEKWVIDDEVVQAENSIEARGKLRLKIGEEREKNLGRPCRVVIISSEIGRTSPVSETRA